MKTVRFFIAMALVLLMGNVCMAQEDVVKKCDLLETRISELDFKLAQSDTTYISLTRDEIVFISVMEYMADHEFKDFYLGYTSAPIMNKYGMKNLEEWYMENKKKITPKLYNEMSEIYIKMIKCPLDSIDIYEYQLDSMKIR